MKAVIAKNLKLLREKLGMTQQQLSDYTGISNREVISQYETCARDIPMETLEKIATLFGVELSAFYMENDEPSPEIYFAYRMDEQDPSDMKSIAEFKQVIMNFEKLHAIHRRNEHETEA